MVSSFWHTKSRRWIRDAGTPREVVEVGAPSAAKELEIDGTPSGAKEFDGTPSGAKEFAFLCAALCELRRGRTRGKAAAAAAASAAARGIGYADWFGVR
jgi:hypothetical protein